MIRLRFGEDKTVAEWVSNLTKGKPFSDPFTAFGVEKNGKIIGGFVFTDYTQDSIEMSAAGYGVVSRGCMAAVVSYVFDQLGCSRLQAHTRASNRTVRRILPNLGFRYEGTVRRFYGTENGLIYSLTIDDLPAFRAKWRLP